ncbi:Fes1-domain-containing protein [Auricularia subglabra TFB-10046 SS5]|uniref:Fes1-domain-containing protein n=1 Tax=Auricularia subglabra (strain TFB-10046 / SS5) TaxID=717982 RepID=J0LJS8_AURST|nr:Fes1-domain-containing protein [Auricularia subglabra TFB-10046 SS5]
MQTLLRWGLENSNPDELVAQAQAHASQQPLDPGIIDHILGKPDAVQMKEALELALDDSKTEDERVGALDHLEMLIESIDNANDMTKLNMWTPLLSLLSPGANSEPIVVNTLWVLGTAVQNNPRAQADFLSRDPIPLLLSSISESPSAEVRAKALYCLAGLLKFSEPAVSRLEELDGWALLKRCLQDDNLPIRRKTAFLFNSLLLPATQEGDPLSPHVQRMTSTAPLARSALTKHGVLQTMLNAVNVDEPDEDLADKIVRVFLMFVQAGGVLDGPVREGVQKLVRTKGGSSETWGLTAGEWKELGQGVGL